MNTDEGVAIRMCSQCGAILSPETKLLNAIFGDGNLCQGCADYGEYPEFPAKEAGREDGSRN